MALWVSDPLLTVHSTSWPQWTSTPCKGRMKTSLFGGKCWPLLLLWQGQQSFSGLGYATTATLRLSGSRNGKEGNLTDCKIMYQTRTTFKTWPCVLFAWVSPVTVSCWTVDTCAAATPATRLCHSNIALFVDRALWECYLYIKSDVFVESGHFSRSFTSKLLNL